MGKTCLILHYYNSIKSNNDAIPVYFEIMGTTDLNEFFEAFSNALLKKIAKSEGGLKRIIKKLASLRPVLSFDPFTGEPKVSMDIRNENEPIYASYLNLLTTKQYKLLRAVALEGYVKSPTASHFLEKHSLGASSSAAQCVESLIGKEFISEESDGLIIQDKFLGQWIRMKAG